MAAVAIRKIDDEYFTAAAGPMSHSPPPIDAAAMIAPGPMTRAAERTENGGAAGRSRTLHASSAPCWCGSVSSPRAAEERIPMFGSGRYYADCAWS
jgi:hypothetical protein